MRRCCDCVTEGCTDCFQPDADNPCCRLGPDDHLMLKIERPGMDVPSKIPNPSCPQCLPFQNIPTSSFSRYEAAPAILVKYEPFEGDAATNGYHWFCDDGAFGEFAAPTRIEHIGALWKLWPPICPNLLTRTVGGNQVSFPGCCNNNCHCSVPNTGTAQYGGPADYLADPAVTGVCGLTDLTNQGNNPNLTNFQKDIIEENPAGWTNTFFSALTCQNACGPGSGSAGGTTLCDYSGYEWLQGIYDDQTWPFSNPSPEIYKHYYWVPPSGGASGFVEEDNILRRLSETIVAVYHPEKWYKRCESTYEYPIGDDKDCNRVTNWGCRVPEYFLYACAGVPIFSWEMKAMLDAGQITSQEYEWLFEARATNTPLGQTGQGRSLINKLETTHWNSNAPSGAALFQTKDWRGATLQDGSTVPGTETRVIRKDLIQYRNGASNPSTIVPDVFYKARPGGWAHVCRNPPRFVQGDGSAICNNALPGVEVRQKAPQVIRNRGCTITDESCSIETVTADTIGRPTYIVTDRCMSAAPVPVCTSCIRGSGCCNLCANDPFGSGNCAGCLPPPTQTCGGSQNNLCNQETYSATCTGIHFTWRGYWYDYTDSGSTPSRPEKCIASNSAYLWVVKDNCRDLNPDDDGPNSCNLGCPANPPEGLPPANEGIVPGTIATREWKCGCGTSHCPHSRGLGRVGVGSSGGLCLLDGTNGGSPGTPPSIGQGYNQKGPFDQDGCGRYLCNEGKNFVLGACCINGECVEGVTQAECEGCTGGVWQGWNSCCSGVSC